MNGAVSFSAADVRKVFITLNRSILLQELEGSFFGVTEPNDIDVFH